MRPLTCAAARRRLQAFHDAELSVADQIAVTAHLNWCETCAAALSEVRLVGSALRAGASRRSGLSSGETAVLATSAIGRCKAERDGSVVARVRNLFDEVHLVYAGVGAAVASVLCVAIMLSMMRYATDERPDSLAAIVNLMATPGSSANTILIDAASHERGTARFQAANQSAEQDAVFALAAIVTHDGRLMDVNRLRISGRKATREEVDLVQGLMDAVTRARIDPPTGDRARTQSNGMVWLVTSTTVRATKVFRKDVPLPPAGRKRMTRLWGLTSGETTLHI